MWIEVNVSSLHSDNSVNLFNTRHIRCIQLDSNRVLVFKHGVCIEYEFKTASEAIDVYNGFKTALEGFRTDFKGKGYIAPYFESKIDNTLPPLS
jgi:hypothetical protein